MSKRAHRGGRGWWGWTGAVVLLVGMLGTSVLALGQPAGATTTTGLTTVTVTSPDATTYDLSFTVNQSTGTPALLAVAIPGAQFPTTGTSFTVTCTPSCTGAPHPAASVWGIGATPAQTGASSVVLNLFADTSAATFAGTFAAGETLTVALTGVTKPTNGPVPVSVATESAPGVVTESGSTTIPAPTPPITPALRTTGVVAGATPNAGAYPDATWTEQLSALSIATGTTGTVSLYVPGATFPTTGTDYTASTCVETTGGTASTVATCTGVTVAVDPATSGLPGTAVILDVDASALAATALTGLTVAVAGVANPSGAGTAATAVVAGEGTTTFADLIGAGTSNALTFVASPTVGLSSADDPAFPSSAVVGTTTGFGLTVANATDYSWPADGASVTLTLGGIASLAKGDVSVQCAYEGTPPAGSTATFTFAFTAKGSTLVSSPVDVPLETNATLELDCSLALSGTAPTGSLTVGVALNDDTGSTPFVLASAAGTLTVEPTPTTGYTLAAADGGIFTYGTASFYGSMGGKPLNQPIVGMAPTPTGQGYWLVASDGGVFSFGNAQFYGSMGGKPLNQPIVGMAATPTGGGYWEVASDGGLFSFGNAQFYGSMGGKPLNKPIVGMAATPTGGGYWEVASDGGIFSFGSAAFEGSAGGLALKAPVVGMATAPGGGGYWLVAADGGVFTFGDATFEGSAGALTLAKPVVGMATAPGGGGYWLVAADGGVFTFGDATFEGSAGGLTLVAPVVGIS